MLLFIVFVTTLVLAMAGFTYLLGDYETPIRASYALLIAGSVIGYMHTEPAFKAWRRLTTKEVPA